MNNVCFSDVYIYADHFTGNKAGKSPGFGLILTAETTTGTLLSSEVISKTIDPDAPKKEPTVPEDLGVQGAYSLLEEVYRLDMTHALRYVGRQLAFRSRPISMFKSFLCQFIFYLLLSKAGQFKKKTETFSLMKRKA